MIKCWQVNGWICGDAGKILKLPGLFLIVRMLTNALFISSFKFISVWKQFVFLCDRTPCCSVAYLDFTGPFLTVYVSTVSTEGPPSCPKGCDRCSEYNGCIKCKPKLFIFLERNDIRQIGVCLASCPMGYFGMRNPEGNNRCTREFGFESQTVVGTFDLQIHIWILPNTCRL